MKILSIVKYDLIKMLRDRTALIFAILLPVVFTLVTGYIFGSIGGSDKALCLPVGIANHDGSEYVRGLLAEVKKDKAIYIKELDVEELYSQVKNGDVEVSFIIPEGFSERVKQGKTPDIKVLKLPASSGFIAVERIFCTAFSKLQIYEAAVRYAGNQLKGIQANNREEIIETLNKKVSENLKNRDNTIVETIKYVENQVSTEYNAKAQASIGYLVMFVMFTLILSAGDILDERKTNTWDRLRITPTSKVVIVLGKMLGAFSRGWLQVAFLMLFGVFVMGIGWGNSFPATAVVMSAYLLCVTAMGMFLSSLVKTNAQLGAYSSIVVICSSMMSGCWWPVDSQPAFMQRIAVIFPQYWAIKGLTNTVVSNMGFRTVTKTIIALMAIGTVFFVLAVFNQRFKMKVQRHEY
jgi:ABC-2 type transport system permease protein